ncbi:YncE family protein [Bacillus tianshenii]|nr:YncE family protein [Bacillus tianshenii]
MKKAVLYFSLLIGILTGCNQEQYEALSPEEEVLISVNVFDSSLSFFDVSEYKELATWDLPFPLTGAELFPDGEKVLLYGKGLEQVYVYDLTTGKQVEKWETGKGITNVRLSHRGEQFYVADESESQIRFFDLEGREKGAVSVGKAPLSMVESKTGGELYVLHFEKAEIDVIDVQARNVVRKLPAKEAATGLILLEDQQELWFGGHGAGVEVQNKISVLSLEQGRISSEIEAPVMPVAFAQADEDIFALSHGSNTLRKIDPATKEIKETLTVGANPFTLTTSKRKIYIAGYDSNEIQVVDSDTMKKKATMQTGEGPFQLLVWGGEN